MSTSARALPCLAVLLLAGCAGSGDESPVVAEPPPEQALPSSVACKDYDGRPMVVEAKTITLYNDTEDSTIYPVLATSKNAVNEWLQGCLRTTDPHPTDFVYKLYVNEGEGIAPGSSVTITLPLFSELAQDRYITWWNGGRVVLADRNERLREPRDVKLAMPDGVGCEGQGTACELSVYSSDVQFPENVYAQLSEYTFGDSIVPPGESLRLLKPENVGYNISYVDHVYMPVAIGPKNNPYIGYSGSAQPLSRFRSGLSSFLGSAIGEGWPVYNIDTLKLPGGYNVFAQRSGTLPPKDDAPVKPIGGFPPVLTVLSCVEGQCSEAQKQSLHFGEAVQRMQNLWGSCVAWNEDLSGYVTEQIDCPQDMKDKMEAVRAFFAQNHVQYLQMYAEGKCQGSTPLKPEFDYWEAVLHIYGWVPFNEGCGADANPLSDTTIPGWDHAKVQSMYIHDLQYNYRQAGVIANPELSFNPYVQLIHGDLELNAYGFSVDDAVGFMSELGDGLIFTVGGTNGLENGRPFDYAEGFSLALGVPQSMENSVNTPLIKKYGVCVLSQDADDPECRHDKQDVVMPGSSQIAGFRVGTVAAYPIIVRFTDLDDNLYTIRVNAQFAPCTYDLDPSQCPTNRAQIVDPSSCSVVNAQGQTHPKSSDWCQNANPNQQRDKQLTKNFLSYPQPVDYMQ